MNVHAIGRFCLAVLLGALAGCTSSGAHLEAARDSLTSLEELVQILRTVQDQDSMPAAALRLKKHAAAEAALKARTAALPGPSAAVLEQLQSEFGEAMQAAWDQIQAEVRRIGALPGGSEFLDGLGRPGLRPDRADGRGEM